MKIAVAQTKPVKGDIQRNTEGHKKLIGLAIANGADIIVFPELSITGYEPELAKELATDIYDKRFDDFQKLSDSNAITIGIGMPIRVNPGICIGMILFQPNSSRSVYFKQYIHEDEEPFFISGQNEGGVIGEKNDIALAICYELNVAQHAEDAFNKGAKYYIASAVKSKSMMEKNFIRLEEISKKYGMSTFLSNCVGESGGYDCGGKSSIWNNKGELLAQLNETSEGILIFDTENNEVRKIQFEERSTESVVGSR
jgi:predicted amidohydrolase